MQQRSGDGVIILFNLLFAVLATLALLVGGWSGVATVLTVAVYFILSSCLFVLAATGGLRDVLLELIQQSSSLIRLVLVALLTRRRGNMTEMQALDLDQKLFEVTPTTRDSYVPAVASSKQATRQQARAWLLSLFDEGTGTLRADKVHMTNSRETDGWLKAAVPAGDVRQLLVSSGALLYRQNGYALDRGKVSSIEDADRLLYIG
jgi:hypothetical protein